MTMITHEVLPFETDMYGNMFPSQLLRYAMHASAERLYVDCLDKAIERSGLNAGWMLARIKIEQSSPVRAGDVIEIRCSQRAVQGAAYVRQVRILRGGEAVAICLLMWMLIDMDKRRILRVSEIEKHTDLLPEPVSLPEISRLTLRKDMPERARCTVLRSDCDVNGHLSSANYVDIICDRFDFWTQGPQRMRSLQLDFHSEFLPEDEIVLFAETSDNTTAVRGAHASGSAGFSAVFSVEKSGLDTCAQRG